MRSRVCLTVARPSVCLSVCHIRSLYAAAAGLLLWARRAGYIERLLHGRRSAVLRRPNAGSAKLSADAEAAHRLSYSHFFLFCSVACSNFHDNKLLPTCQKCGCYVAGNVLWCRTWYPQRTIPIFIPSNYFWIRFPSGPNLNRCLFPFSSKIPNKVDERNGRLSILSHYQKIIPVLFPMFTGFCIPFNFDQYTKG